MVAINPTIPFVHLQKKGGGGREVLLEKKKKKKEWTLIHLTPVPKDKKNNPPIISLDKDLAKDGWRKANLEINGTVCALQDGNKRMKCLQLDDGV